MRFYNKYLLILLFVCPILSDDEIMISENDLTTIAESLVLNGDYQNAIAIYQQILEYQINTFGLINTEVANSSEMIGRLLMMMGDPQDAEVYIKQAIRINSNLLLQKQIKLKPSLEILKEIYSYNDDSVRYNYINEQIDAISMADTIHAKNDLWDPIIYGLDTIENLDANSLDQINTLKFRSDNLLSIADSYFEADLYFDAVLNLLNAISMDSKNISIPFLNEYLSKYESKIPSMVNTLTNYSNQDSTYIYNKDILLSFIYAHQEEFDLANKYIDRYIDIKYSDPRAYQLKGDYHRYNEDYLSALFSYRKSDEIDGGSLYSLYQQSLCLLNLYEYGEAVSVLTKVVNLSPYHIDAYFYRGVANQSINNFNQAIKDLTNHILINPDYPETYYNLGICYFKTKQFHKAKESLERYITINNKNAIAHYYLGMIYENILDTENAINHYSYARKFDPNISESNLQLGLIQFNERNYTKAVEPLRDYIIQHPDSLNILEIFADVLFYEKRYPEAIDAYKRLYQSENSHIDHLIKIADAYIELNDMVNAKETLTKIILLGNVNSDIVFTLANIEVGLEDYNNAITHFLMATQMGNPTIDMYYNLAMTYAKVGNYMQALIAFQNAHNIDSNDYEIIYQIAICYKELNMYSESLNYLQIFLVEFPNDYIGHFLMGELYYLNKNFTLAEKYFKNALSINPTDYTSLYYIGLCYFEKPDYVSAAKYFKKSIKIEPDYAQSHFHLAIAYNMLGKAREVKKEMNIIYMLDQALHEDLKNILDAN